MADASPPALPRVTAIAILRRGSEVLISFAIDPESGRRYGRFLGGGVEPGERAADAVRREIREEIGAELEEVCRLGVVENLYASAAHRVHEIIFVFAASFADRALYRREAFRVDEAVCDGPARWVPLDRLRSGDLPVYPAELVALVTGDGVPTPAPADPSNDL